MVAKFSCWAANGQWRRVLPIWPVLVAGLLTAEGGVRCHGVCCYGGQVWIRDGWLLRRRCTAQQQRAPSAWFVSHSLRRVTHLV